MKNKVSRNRWEHAQKLELKDWKKENTVNNEIKELEKKYSLFLKELSRRISFSKNWKILDIGCGPTCVSRFFPEANKMGIDPLSDKLKLSGKKISGVKIVQGRGEELPFKNNEFDLIICRNAIDHSQSPEKIIEESARVLKDNCFFVLACYIYPSFIVFLKNLSEKLSLFRNMEHPSSFTAEDLEKLSLFKYKIIETKIIYEGKHSTDFGKVGHIEPDRSLVNKIVMFLNKLVGNNWFVREYLLLLKKSRILCRKVETEK